MSSTEFFREARQLGLKLNLTGEGPSPVHTLDNEALFQLPLLAMTILAKKSTPVPWRGRVSWRSP
mgnify:CR=1 FL=1